MATGTTIPWSSIIFLLPTSHSCNQRKSDTVCQRAAGHHYQYPAPTQRHSAFRYLLTLLRSLTYFTMVLSLMTSLKMVRTLQQDFFPTFSRTFGFTHCLLHFQGNSRPFQAFRRRKGFWNSYLRIKLLVLLPTHYILLQKGQLMTLTPSPSPQCSAFLIEVL